MVPLCPVLCQNPGPLTTGLPRGRHQDAQGSTTTQEGDSRRGQMVSLDRTRPRGRDGLSQEPGSGKLCEDLGPVTESYMETKSLRH